MRDVGDRIEIARIGKGGRREDVFGGLLYVFLFRCRSL